MLHVFPEVVMAFGHGGRTIWLRITDEDGVPRFAEATNPLASDWARGVAYVQEHRGEARQVPEAVI